MTDTEQTLPLATPDEPGLPESVVAAKRALIGRPLATGQLGDRLLPKFLALPIFSSDPISSVAYATEAALAVLVAASVSSAHLVFPISIAIAALLLIVALSYRQGIAVYQSSGGSYVFAKENLGIAPALVAAASTPHGLRLDRGGVRRRRHLRDHLCLPRPSPGTRSHSRSPASSSSRSETCAVFASRFSFRLPNLRIHRLALRSPRGRRRGTTLLGDPPVATVPHPVAVGTGTLASSSF